MPSFHLEEVPKNSSFEQIVPVFWSACTNPRNSIFEFIYPVKGPSKDAYNTAVKDSRKRLSNAHSKDPTSFWIQIVDDETGKIIAAAEWHVYADNKTNPHARDSYPPMDSFVNWWPEGDTKRFVLCIFDEALRLPRLRQRRPHITLNKCFTDPGYRRKGAAIMMLDWGVKRADELELEIFVAAEMDMGVPLYEKAKFVKVDRTRLCIEDVNPSDEWKECQEQLGVAGWDNMWRPIGGKYEKGVQYPWEE